MSRAAPWPQTKEQLAAAHCLFGVDRVAGQPAEVTEFKRRARWQQAWWREANKLEIGEHLPPRAPKPVPNGSRLRYEEARRDGSNFLSPRIRAAVDDRLAHPQPHETLNERRLWRDLLSSMPMCFNLFGELHDDPEKLTEAVDALWPGHPGAPTRIDFEWSPGRRQPDYLNNRSAFDAAILLDLPDGGRGVLGIETKYHEDIRRERPPHPEKRMPRYREVTERSGAFLPGWEAKVVGTDLQQLWLDHLLLLSMLQHPTARWQWGRFVIVYPAANPSVREASRRYADLLVHPESFESRTIEELLGPGVLHDPATAEAFRDRYLW
jgi:PD-(D/E)XK nuclease superfamily protein